MNNNSREMTSLDIAEITGKRHGHVKRDIQKMFHALNLGTPKFGYVPKNRQNQGVTAYSLDEDLTFSLISKYSVQMHQAVTKRWQELEALDVKF